MAFAVEGNFNSERPQPMEPRPVPLRCSRKPLNSGLPRGNLPFNNLDRKITQRAGAAFAAEGNLNALRTQTWLGASEATG